MNVSGRERGRGGKREKEKKRCASKIYITVRIEIFPRVIIKLNGTSLFHSDFLQKIEK